jgi:hypothetical protein
MEMIVGMSIIDVKCAEITCSIFGKFANYNQKFTPEHFMAFI